MRANERASFRAEWPSILLRARVVGSPMLPVVPKLFGSSSKVLKGRAAGIETAVCYMSPDQEAFAPGDHRTLCPSASLECSSLCLGHSSGRMIMQPLKLARLWKTALFLGDRARWRTMLTAEATAFVSRCERSGMIPALRVDGASDTGEGARLTETLIDRAWVYDYTKIEGRALAFARGRYAPNYSVTFSYSGHNADACKRVLAAGVNVAVCFDTPRGADLPATFWDAPVVDGDEHDARFLEYTAGTYGAIIGLRFKSARNRAAAISQAGAFVVRV